MRENNKIHAVAILTMAFFITLVSCSTPEERMLEESLDFAGANRGELERVIEHYDDEPEKQEAAKFLIRNMPRYYSYRGWQLDTIKSKLAYLSKTPSITDMTIVADPSLEHVNTSSLRKVYDSHVITARYLIDNIDRAFTAWRSRPWNRSLCFDDFCELILPYRIGNEPLSDWRRLYAGRYSRMLDSLYHGSDVVEACRVADGLIAHDGCKYYSRFSVPHLEATFLFNNRIGECREECDIGTYAMRACGIPVATDSYHWSPWGTHQWLVVRDTTGIYLQFDINNIKPSRGKRSADNRKKGKVWRNCFGAPYQKDVTSNYFGHNTARVAVAGGADNIFLGLFSPMGWFAIGSGKFNGDSVAFHDIEPNVIYAPVARRGARYEAVGHAFMLDGATKRCRVFRADTSRLVAMTLTRKMPLGAKYAARLDRAIVGARIEASADSTFRQRHVVREFTAPLNYHVERIANSSSTRFRYLRFVAPKGVAMELADIAAYADTACSKRLPMRLVTKLSPVTMPQNITDGDMLTPFYAPMSVRSITFDFSRLTTLAAIDFYPRTDGNFIMPGDTYELLYHDGANGWKSLGTQIATGRTVKFSGPSGALFWLRDLTRGREEQVFIYEHGKQVFVADMPCYVIN